MTHALDRGREAYARQAWGDAFAHFRAADRETPLGPDDLERLATAAYLCGRDSESAELWARTHHERLARADPDGAARAAFWLAFGLFRRGEAAQGGGWLARAARVLDEAGAESVVRGYLLVPQAIASVGRGDPDAALRMFARAGEIAHAFGDADLLALARCGSGRALIRLGRIQEGVALLDEAMVAATAGELSALVAGDVYCTVLEGCQETCDVSRAREWTAALTAWCEAQPDLVPYRGQCLVYRTEILRLQGAWSEAARDAARACERLSDPPRAAAGAAFYQRAELHRLRGEYAEAEDAYREASRAGRSPQPGLALLRLAQGQIDDATAAIRHTIDGAQSIAARSEALAAYVDIMLAADDASEARAAVGELSRVTTVVDAPLLVARLAYASGAVLLAEGDGRAALGALRQAWTAWSQVGAPYEVARTRVLMAQAARLAGDRDGASLELDAARAVFVQLGAAPDVERVEDLCRAAPSPPRPGLTGRELQVLRLLARGQTNRAIADALSISEKTVARHVSNIFDKLDLPNRAAAAAYAYRQRLL